MFRYEEHLARKQKMNFSNEQWEKIWMVSPSESIEHIWAKSQAPDKARHRLGNLVLLPPKLNSTLQDRPAKDKAAHYRKTGLLIAGEVADIIDVSGWKSKSVRSVKKSCSNWAAKEWRTERDGMEFRIADTFTDSLARLTGDEQKAVKTTAFDLQNSIRPALASRFTDSTRRATNTSGRSA